MESGSKKIYFDLLKTKWQRCLDPEESCEQQPIRAHSLQNARILDQLCRNGHVIMPSLRHNSDGESSVAFNLVGRNKATIFMGLCAKHDERTFKPIDAFHCDFSNPQHLFLISYRSILKEAHACFEKAYKKQTAYMARVSGGLSPGDKPDAAGLEATAWLVNAYDTYRYKRIFDEAYLGGDYAAVHYLHFEFADLNPSIGVSSLFSLDDLEWPEDVARVTLNVFPLDKNVHVIFTFTEVDRPIVHQFLDRVRSASEYYQRYLISKIILQHCENFVISPQYFDGMSQEKQEAIKSFFETTCSKNLPDFESEHLYLF